MSGAVKPAARVGRWLLAATLFCWSWATWGQIKIPLVVGKGVVLACAQPDAGSLRCNYRLTGSGRLLAINASANEQALPNPTFAARKGTLATTSVLFLLDTADPARAAVIAKAREHIARVVDAAQPHQNFGLATFDHELHMLAAMGGERSFLKSALGALKPKGSKSDLYANLMSAIELLAVSQDEHKILVVLADGQAEGGARIHSRAVQLALENNIALYGIGYSHSSSQSGALDSLGRLAAETGGQFIATDAKLELPEQFFNAPFASIYNVGALSINFRAALSTWQAARPAIEVHMDTTSGSASATVPVTAVGLALSTDPAIVTPTAATNPEPVSRNAVVRVPVRVITNRAPRSKPVADASVPLWYWAAAVLLLAITLLALLLVLLLRRRTANLEATAIVAEEEAAVAIPLVGRAFLYLDDEFTQGQRAHPIESESFRIGRLTGNDLSIRDPSVSRHHAQIRRRRDGSFQVFDLDSMNGVFVNGKRIRESALNEGDHLEIGDVSMTFSAEADLPISERKTYTDNETPRRSGAGASSATGELLDQEFSRDSSNSETGEIDQDLLRDVRNNDDTFDDILGNTSNSETVNVESARSRHLPGERR